MMHERGTHDRTCAVGIARGRVVATRAHGAPARRLAMPVRGAIVRAIVRGAIVRGVRGALVALVVMNAAACDEPLDQRLAIVDAPRVLAVIAEPAEARPGATVTYRAILAGPDGPITAAPTWAYCTSPKAPTEDNVVSTGCVAGDALVPLDPGADAMSATGTLPMDGCLRFGPDVPPGGFRPRDADRTGGFYQPVRVDTAALAPLSFGLSRIICNLANATPEAFRQYSLDYVANRNPTLDAPMIDGAIVDATTRVGADTDVTLTATWSVDSAEGYLYYDRDRQALVDRRESLRISWFATGGAFPVDSIAIDEGAAETSETITWRTPGSIGPATLWLVLRDARGGTAVQSATIAIE